jgi:Smg protein
MKESILDVLLYLFEHYFASEELAVTDVLGGDDSPVLAELVKAGFSPEEVNKAFDWLDALSRQRPAVDVPRRDGPVRVFHPDELARLDVAAIGFLLTLERHGVLDPHQRELVLDRALALDQEEVSLEDLKWVVLMVLFDQPGSEAAYAWMETQMFADDPESLH